MCGRFTLYANPFELVKQFQLDERTNLLPSYNIAPSQNVLTVCEIEKKRLLVTMRWGLIPFWLKKNEKIPSNLINARVETIDQKPAFKNSFLTHRCLIIANGFYEWKNEGGVKQPYYFQQKDGSLIAFAGIYSQWKGEYKVIDSCAIITGKAQLPVSAIHERMPLIISPEDYDSWLDHENRDSEILKYYLSKNTYETLESYPVSRIVNSPDNNSYRCIKPLEKT